jgi:2-aminoadipate transaminase
VCGIENILITSGSQQALDLIGKVMVNPGDRILVEEPTYVGALQAWRPYEPAYIPVPVDNAGMRTDLLESVLRETHPKLIYALPNFQNPSGVTLSNKRRVELIDLAERYGVPIIEDDPYGQLRYEGDHECSLFALDAMKSKTSGSVLYLSTFSKTLCPGLRVGWVVGPESVIRQMVQAKQGMDLHTSTFVQMLAYETARGDFLDQHIQQLRRAYAVQRDFMLALMADHFPPGIKWTRPAGGLFIWVTLPRDMNSTTLLKKALEHRVAFVPGNEFYPCGGGENTFRLNFSYPSMEDIEMGIRRLAAVLTQEMQLIAQT